MPRILAFVMLMACAGCAVGPAQNLNVQPNEAAVIGKISIIYNGDDVTENAQVLFNEHVWGSYAYLVPKDGWIVTKLPLGQNNLDRLVFARFLRGVYHHDFTSQQTGFTLTDNQHVNYIGHIVVNWNGTGFKPSQLFGLVGAVIDEMSSDGQLQLAVKNEQPEAVRKVKEQYGIDAPLVASLVGGQAAVALNVN